ncbi:MAG TPA: hypothetical protein P5186_28100 [Candidatus Paceibacterota bacterium]|nr:hypothetical protein [Candidatus Paceibacterota bacterium]
MRSNNKIPTRNRVLFQIKACLTIAVIVLFSILTVTAAERQTNGGGLTTATRREITEDAFAKRAAGMVTNQRPNSLIASLEFAPQEARIVRLVIRRSHAGAPCLDELEIYGPGSSTNLAHAKAGAVARASSLLSGYAIHAVPHLNDGLYGNDHSWIAATDGEEWAQIELPAPARLSKILFSRDRTGQFNDRQVLEAEARLSMDGQSWLTVATFKRTPSDLRPAMPKLTFP